MSQNAGWLYLVILILFFAGMILPRMFGAGGEDSLYLNLILSDGPLIICSLLFVILTHSGWKETFRFRKVKLPTLLLSILYILLWYPLIIALNALTMLVSKNAVLEASEGFLGIPYPILWIIAAVIAPLSEELTFRGAILSGLKSGGRILAAILLQGLLFGILHLNLNQMVYAAAMGIAFGLLVETTGSIWTSFICHLTVNTVGTAALYLESSLLGGLEEALETAEAQTVSPGMFLGVACVMLLAACLTLPLSLLLLKALACLEGREEQLRRIRPGKQEDLEENKTRVVTLPVVLSLILGGIFIIIRTAVL